MANKTIIFKVSGMSCNGCAAAIGNALTRLNGVIKAEASFQKGVTEVKFDATLVEKQRLVETIETLGYHVEGEL